LNCISLEHRTNLRVWERCGLLDAGGYVQVRSAWDLGCLGARMDEGWAVQRRNPNDECSAICFYYLQLLPIYSEAPHESLETRNNVTDSQNDSLIRSSSDRSRTILDPRVRRMCKVDESQLKWKEGMREG
jgi:hypothetical protein